MENANTYREVKEEDQQWRLRNSQERVRTKAREEWSHCGPGKRDSWKTNVAEIK